MTIDEARAVFDPLRVGDEGYLDAAARIERKRALSQREREAIDVICRDFDDEMHAMREGLCALRVDGLR